MNDDGMQNARNLAIRLAEAEATIAALLSGQIDAVVDSRSRTPVLLDTAQKALVGSETRYRALVEWSPESIVVSRHGFILFVNPAAIRMMGATCEGDLVGASILDLVHPEDRQAKQQRIDEVERTGLLPLHDTRLIRLDGAIIDVETQSLSMDYNGEPAMFSSIRDVTESKRAAEALRESNEKFELLVNNITDAFWIRSADMRVLHYISPAFERIWGRSTDSFYASPLNWSEHILEEDRERVLAAFATLEDDARSIDVAYRIMRSGGEVRWVRSRGFQVLDASGGLIRLTGIVTDITDAKQAAESLQRNAEELVTLTEAMPQIAWITRPDGWNIYFNQQWMDYTGLTQQESRGDGWTKPFHPEDRKRAIDAWQNATTTDGTYSIECRLRRADGIYHWWLIRGVPLRDASGTVLKWFGTCTDIQELKLAQLEVSSTNRALQEEIVERSRAEHAADAANRSKSEFLANMSHEIRTPLNGVVGMTDLMLETDLTDEQRACLQIIRSSGDTLLAVINDILDFSKIEAGKLNVDALPFDLHDCLAEPLRQFGAQAHAKGLELLYDVGADVPAAFLGDSNRLRQIVTNLLGNAIKFTERGKVVLSVAVVEQTAVSATLMFSVADTGIGVAREKHAAILQPFVQADGSITRKYGGTGLGLAISTKLATLLGGRLWLESEPQKGSAFHFTMPLALMQPTVLTTGAPGRVPRPQVRQAGRKLRVLVAEDNDVNRLIAAQLLERRGHAVVTANNGREALAALESAGPGAFDVVLMDLQMPEMDGLEATMMIRAREASAGAHVPIIALTAHAMKGDEERCLAAGMDGYVSKPIRVDDLVAEIERVIA